MSDRIDELVKRAVDPRIDGWERRQVVAELATIALKAEAMFERLVKYAADCGECPRTRYDEDEDGCRECLDSIRRNAERVIRG